ncbi:MAG: glycosyltransferase family 2 protein [Chloroflexi bacterium]|nr:glycosyltransferase family 2 protein [Chloroflexota bacterium]
MAYILSVVVPAYNESKTIIQVVERLLSSLSAINFEIIIVDDCSKDDTAVISQLLTGKYDNVRLVKHKINKGKTEALKTGFQECSGEIVMIQDGDLEYDPKDIMRVIQPILDNQADLVYGSRLLDPDHKNVFMVKSLVANKTLTFLSNLFTRYKFSDVETCYKAFRCSLIKNMIITSERFGFEIEVTAKISKLRLRTCEIPISYYCRSYAEGKKIGIMDGIHAIGYILKYNLFTSVKKSFREIPKNK